MKTEATQESITLQLLLEQAEKLPQAKVLWNKYVTPEYSEFELCWYWAGSRSTTLVLKNLDDNISFEIWWERNKNKTCIDAYDEDLESAALHQPLVDKILQMEIKE